VFATVFAFSKPENADRFATGPQLNLPRKRSRRGPGLRIISFSGRDAEAVAPSPHRQVIALRFSPVPTLAGIFYKQMRKFIMHKKYA